MASELLNRYLTTASLPSGITYPFTLFQWSRMPHEWTRTTNLQGSGDVGERSTGKALRLAKPSTFSYTHSMRMERSLSSNRIVRAVTSNSEFNESSAADHEPWGSHIWYSTAGYYEDTDERQAWIDDNSTTNIGTSVTDFGTADGIAIGDWHITPPIAAPRGNSSQAYCVIWDKKLLDRDLIAISHGVNPFIIEHESQQLFMPLHGNVRPDNNAMPKWGKDHDQSIETFFTYTAEDDFNWNLHGYPNNVKINTVDNRLEITVQSGTAGSNILHGHYYPRTFSTDRWSFDQSNGSISGTFSDVQWKFRYKLTAASYTTTITDDGELLFGLGNPGEYPPLQEVSLYQTTLGRAQDWSGIAIRADSATNQYQIWGAQKTKSALPNKLVKFDTTLSTNDIIYVEQQRLSRTRMQINLFSDSSYSTLMESKVFTINQDDHIQYNKVCFSNDRDLDDSVTFVTYFDDLQFWDSHIDFSDADVGQEEDEWINRISLTHRNGDYRPAKEPGPPVEPLENYI